MGVKHFWGIWLKKQFADHLKRITSSDRTIPTEIDNLLIDMNGIFHMSAQKIYQYGNYKPPVSLFGHNRNRRLGGLKKQKECFADVCATIDSLIHLINPKKRVIMCVDGVAPLAKQYQQRSRRFRSTKDREGESANSFDSCCISPGTKWMDYLTKYIDWYIRKKISEDPVWKNLHIIFSNEKAPGEGEHGLLNYIRLYGDKNESYCLHGMDADLIFLGMSTHLPKFYILRDEIYETDTSHYFIDVSSIAEELACELTWVSENKENTFNHRSAVDDFVCMLFIVGNDFLPHIPSIEIISNGIEVMFTIYKDMAETYGHLTTRTSEGVKINLKPLEVFFLGIGQYEQTLFQQKLDHKSRFIEDPLLESCASINDEGKHILDLERYKEVYYAENLPEEKSLEKLCHDYLEGIQWVLTYYTIGVPNWNWIFGRHYAPFASDLTKHVSTFHMPVYPRTSPSTPFIQLLSILSPQSAGLLPSPLNALLSSSTSPLAEYCPSDFKIDCAGKRREWEGIVIIPFMDQELVRREYFDRLSQIDSRDLRRNILGKSFAYMYNPNSSFTFNSYYGNIPECRARVEVIDL